MPTITGLTDVDLNFDHLAECSGFFTVKLLFPSSLHTVPFGWSHYAQPTLKEWGGYAPGGQSIYIRYLEFPMGNVAITPLFMYLIICMRIDLWVFILYFGL